MGRTYCSNDENELDKGEGIDGISGQFVEHAPEEWLRQLLNLFNLTWKKRYIPKVWRTAEIIPIFKGVPKDPSSESSHRPVSVTCLCCKLMERLMLGRLLY